MLSAAPAVVIGLDTLVGLQTTRILASRGIRVIGVASADDHPAVHTRAAAEVIISPTWGDDLVASIRALAGRCDVPPVLFPCRDPSVEALSEHRGSLGDVRLLLPDHGVVRSLADKGSFAEVARAAGLATPRTWTVTTSDPDGSLFDELRFPAVVKPTSRSDAWDASGSPKGFVAEDLASVRRALAQIVPLAPRAVVQEWIPGPMRAHLTCNLLLGSDGEVRGTFVSRKIRRWPPSTGVGSMGEAFIDDEVVDLTVRLHRAVGFRGLSYLELKRDARDGTLVAIEANPGRPTGRSALADRCGVELLYGAYREAIGEPLEDCGAQRPTRRAWVHLRSDLQAGAHDWRSGSLTLGAWLASYARPIYPSVLRLRDPVPSLVSLRRLARKLANRRRGSA